MRTKIIIDGRNLWDNDDLKEYEFIYEWIGKRIK
jgi:hypothetical protein